MKRKKRVHTRNYSKGSFADYDIPADAEEITDEQREELIKESMTTTIIDSAPSAPSNDETQAG